MKIYEKLIGLSNFISKENRLFFFDTDEKAIYEDEIQELCNDFDCDILVFKSNNGFHLLSFNIFNQYECESMFYRLKVIYPHTDYFPPTNCRILSNGLNFIKNFKYGWELQNRIQVIRLTPKTSKDKYSWVGSIISSIPGNRTVSKQALILFIKFHPNLFWDDFTKNYNIFRQYYGGETQLKLVEYSNTKFTSYLLNLVQLNVRGDIIA